MPEAALDAAQPIGAAIALAGAAALLLAPFAARNLATEKPFAFGGAELAAGTVSTRRRLGWRLSTTATRALLILLRAIPEYVWAFLFLAMLGPSAWPAVLALAIAVLALVNRRRLLPILGGDAETVGRPAIRRLASFVRAEALLALAVLAVLCSVISAFFYLRIAVFMYMTDPEGSAPVPLPATVTAALAFAALVTLLGGIFPGTFAAWTVPP